MGDKELTSLLQKAASGDMSAFEEAYNGLKTPIFTLIRRTGCNYALAEDVTQELFVKLFALIKETIPEKPRAYIFKSARNLAIDALRKEKDSLPETELESLPARDADAVFAADFSSAMARLDETDRQIVTLHLNAGFKFVEISKIVEMPLGTVLWRYRRAVLALRESLKED